MKVDKAKMSKACKKANDFKQPTVARKRKELEYNCLFTLACLNQTQVRRLTKAGFTTERGLYMACKQDPRTIKDLMKDECLLGLEEALWARLSRQDRMQIEADVRSFEETILTMGFD